MFGHANREVVLDHVFQLAFPSGFPRTKSQCDIFRRLTAALFHANKPVRCRKAAVPEETGHKGLQELVVKHTALYLKVALEQQPSIVSPRITVPSSLVR